MVKSAYPIAAPRRCKQRQLGALRAAHQTHMATTELGLAAQPIAGGSDDLYRDLAQP